MACICLPLYCMIDCLIGSVGPEYVKMPMLTPRVRNIPQEVVENKWGPLSEKAKDEFLEVMKVAERPVLMTFGNEKKRAEAQKVLDGALRRYGT